MSNKSVNKLSIITVNLNNASGLKKTIDSVLSQSYPDFEHIIIDGGSTDGSVEIIQKYADTCLPFTGGLYWVSEKDSGIYNAMNKGIKQAKGEYCLFLNSGDWLLASNSIESVFSYRYTHDILYCDVQTSVCPIIYQDELTFLFFFSGTLCHQATFIRTDLFEKFGKYDEKLKITSDWAFFLKTIILNHCSCIHINEFISFYDGGGISSNKKVIDNEREYILKGYFPLIFNDYIYLSRLSQELEYYKGSRFVQLIKRIQYSRMYKGLKQLFSL